MLTDVEAGSGAAHDTRRRVMEALAAPLGLDGREASVRASVGLAVFPADAGNAGGLLERADAAMYAAKARRR